MMNINLIPPSVFALAFHGELEYRHLDERINSAVDADTFGELWFSNPRYNVA